MNRLPLLIAIDKIDKTDQCSQRQAQVRIGAVLTAVILHHKPVKRFEIHVRGRHQRGIVFRPILPLRFASRIVGDTFEQQGPDGFRHASRAAR